MLASILSSGCLLLDDTIIAAGSHRPWAIREDRASWRDSQPWGTTTSLQVSLCGGSEIEKGRSADPGRNSDKALVSGYVSFRLPRGM